MESKVPYILLTVSLLALNGSIFLTAYLASENNPIAKDLYAAFAPTCHQLTTRSLCLYKYDTDGSFGIGDCLPMSTFSFSKANEVNYPDKTAYKFPVCSRDVAIYLTMLIGLLMLPLFQKIGSEDWPNRWILVAAAVPIAIDGTTQLIGLRESTNSLRVVTGAIIGLVMPFYVLPILNSLYSFLRSKLRAEKEKPAQPGARASRQGKRSAKRKKARR